MAIVGRFFKPPAGHYFLFGPRGTGKSTYGRDTFWAIEVKHSSTVRAKDLVGLRAFREDYPGAGLLLLYRGRDSLEIEGVQCLPVADFLRELVPGRPLERAAGLS